MRLRLALWLAAAGILAQAWTQAAWAQQVPRPASEFAIHMTDGSQVLLSQFRGKVVLLTFMFTT